MVFILRREGPKTVPRRGNTVSGQSPLSPALIGTEARRERGRGLWPSSIPNIETAKTKSVKKNSERKYFWKKIIFQLVLNKSVLLLLLKKRWYTDCWLTAENWLSKRNSCRTVSSRESWLDIDFRRVKKLQKISTQNCKISAQNYTRSWRSCFSLLCCILGLQILEAINLFCCDGMEKGPIFEANHVNETSNLSPSLQ